MGKLKERFRGDILDTIRAGFGREVFYTLGDIREAAEERFEELQYAEKVWQQYEHVGSAPVGYRGFYKVLAFSSGTKNMLENFIRGSSSSEED